MGNVCKAKGPVLQHRGEAEFMWPVWIWFSSCECILAFIRSLQTSKAKVQASASNCEVNSSLR